MFTIALIERSHQIGHGFDIAGQLHLEKLVQPSKSLLREAQVEVRKLARGGDPHESGTNESESIEIRSFSKPK